MKTAFISPMLIHIVLQVAFFQTALAADAILVDEDGHVGLPANVWARG
jgi:hypothetical protein